MSYTPLKSKKVPLNKNLNLTPSNRWKFVYNAENPTEEDSWVGCDLQCMQCLHFVKDKKNKVRQCKRKTCYTLPYCWFHLKTVLKVRIGPTTLCDSEGKKYKFLGLFACDPNYKGGNEGDKPPIVFRKGHIITPYIGEKLSLAELNYRYPNPNEISIYGLQTNKNNYIDAACVRGVASFINACLPSNTILNKKCRINAKFGYSTSHYPSIKAQVNIRDGDEILVSYGTSYYTKNSIFYPFKTTPASYYQKLNYKC
jgi:hypothetical protein